MNHPSNSSSGRLASGDLIAFEERFFPDDLTVILRVDATEVSVPEPRGDFPALFFEGETTRPR
jgi:hypothetical protein